MPRNSEPYPEYQRDRSDIAHLLASPPDRAATHALPPILIPQAVPVTGGLGVGNNARAGGVVVVIEPYGMLLGDLIEVFWGAPDDPDTPGYPGLAMAEKVLQFESELGHNVTLNVPENDVEAGWINLLYRITRTDSGAQPMSLPQRVLVKLDVPGGEDTDPLSPENENLTLPQLPAEIIAGGVDEEWAERGVPVTINEWDNASKGDRLLLSWGGQIIEHRLEEDPNGQPLVIIVDKATILAAGDSTGLVVRYQIYDLVNNRSGWSPKVTLRVTAGGSDLIPPIINDVAGDVLDYDRLNGGVGVVQVMAFPPHFFVGDKITLYWEGQTPGGLTVPWDEEQQTTEPVQILEFKVPNETIKAIIQGLAVVYYILRRPGVSLASPRVMVTIAGQPQPLAAPTIDELHNGFLAPNLTEATVHIAPWLPMTVGDRVILFWRGKGQDGEELIYQDYRDITGAMLEKEVVLRVSALQIQPLDGGELEVWYHVQTNVRNQLESEHLRLKVGTSQDDLPAPTVDEANGEVLDPDFVRGEATVRIVPWDDMEKDDRVELWWDGSFVGSSFYDWIDLSQNMVGEPVLFYVPSHYVTANLNGVLRVRYTVTRNSTDVKYSGMLTLQVVRGGIIDLPTPYIVEANWETIDPSDTEAGATVIITPQARLRPGDLVTVYWQGTGTTQIPKLVAAGEGESDFDVSVPQRVVQANLGQSISMYFTVLRAGSVTPISSPFTIYEVRRWTGPEQILILGARNTNMYSVHRKHASNLSALHRTSRQKIEVRWRYQGEQTEFFGNVFADTKPDKMLHIKYADNFARINPGNIVGSEPGFIALLNRGSLAAWGARPLSAESALLSDVRSINAAAASYVVRRASGDVVAWGRPPDNVNHRADWELTPEIAELTDVVSEFTNTIAFAVLRKNGRIRTWRNAASGGVAPQEILDLTDIIDVAGNFDGFCALRATGEIVTWGGPNAVVPPEDILRLRDIVEVTGHGYGFVVRRRNGSIRVWGTRPEHAPGSAILNLTEIVQVVYSLNAFAIRLSDGTVRAWGDINNGGRPGSNVTNLADVIDIAANSSGFTALRANGKIVMWGGGLAEQPGEDILQLTDIVSVVGNGSKAFAALRTNGEVVAWGGANTGGEIPAELVIRLTNVRAIYPAYSAFAVLTDSSEVITWGLQSEGGNSDAAQELLRGNISYDSVPAPASRRSRQRVVASYPAEQSRPERRFRK